MRVLQAGYPKSGNYLLYNILKRIFDEADLEFQPIIHSYSVNSLASKIPLSNVMQKDIDWIEFRNGQNTLGLSSILKIPLTDDLSQYMCANHIIWTHSEFTQTLQDNLKHFDKVIYIYRDPRSSLVSKANAAMKAYGQYHYPVEGTTKNDIITKSYWNVILYWLQHVTTWAGDGDNILYIKYEDFLAQPEISLNKIVTYLGFDFSEAQISKICDHVSISAMRKREASDTHVRAGKFDEWKTELTVPQKLFATVIIKFIGPNFNRKPYFYWMKRFVVLNIIRIVIAFRSAINSYRGYLK